MLTSGLSETPTTKAEAFGPRMCLSEQESEMSKESTCVMPFRASSRAGSTDQGQRSERELGISTSGPGGGHTSMLICTTSPGRILRMPGPCHWGATPLHVSPAFGLTDRQISRTSTKASCGPGIC